MAIIGALPVTLTNGTIADATQVMADFNYILSQVNANAAPVTGGAYLPLTGGTLTGNLSVGGTLGVTGATTLGRLNIENAAGTLHQIVGTVSGAARWRMLMGNNTAEGGSNAGSDWQLDRFSDAGAFIDTPLTINRATGLVTINSLSSPSAKSLQNFLINPLFNVQQRGAQNAYNVSFAASTNPYTLDRWYLRIGANNAATVVASPLFGSSAGPYVVQVNRNIGQTGTVTYIFAQTFDTDIIQLLAGQQVTIAVQVQALAGFSAAAVSLQLQCGTGAPTRIVTGFTGVTTLINASSAVTPGGGTVTLSGTAVIPIGTRQLELEIVWAPTGTAVANDTLQISVPRLNLGSVDLGPDLTRVYTTELPLCQRFYQKSFSPAIAPAQNAGTGDAVWVRSQVAATTFGQWIAFNGMAGMRIVPVFTTYNPSVANANWRDVVATADRTVQVQPAGLKGIMIEGLAGAAGGANLIHWTADAEIL